MATPVPAVRPEAESPCTLSSHDALKVDPGTFRAATEHHGYQPDGLGGWLELRRCLACGSTLSMEADRDVEGKPRREWTHTLCWSCWNTLCWSCWNAMPGYAVDPARVNGAPMEPCCQCCAPTDAGIYYRQIPSKMTCRGVTGLHAPASVEVKS